MPDRVIRDELLESPRWCGLKDNADRLAYLALLLKADAHGNFTADPWRLLRLWRDFGINNDTAVAKTLAELADHDLVRLYHADNVRYLHIPRYRQSLRFSKRTLPPSPWCSVKNHSDTAKTPGDLTVSTQSALGALHRRSRGEVNEGRSSREATPPAVDNLAEHLSLNAKTDKTKPRADWWKTPEGIERMATRYGITPRPGEGYRELKDRIFAAISAEKSA